MAPLLTTVHLPGKCGVQLHRGQSQWCIHTSQSHQHWICCQGGCCFEQDQDLHTKQLSKKYKWINKKERWVLWTKWTGASASSGQKPFLWPKTHNRNATLKVLSQNSPVLTCSPARRWIARPLQGSQAWQTRLSLKNEARVAGICYDIAEIEAAAAANTVDESSRIAARTNLVEEKKMESKTKKNDTQ